MASSLAFFFFAVFIFWLFVNDSKRRQGISAALWIPLLWLSIIGSRFISTWLGSQSEDVLEGSPLDRMVFLVLIVAAFIVLFKRRVDWERHYPKQQMALWLSSVSRHQRALV
jgi:hypothetical protein